MAWKPNRIRQAKALLMVHQLREGGSERQMTEVARSIDRTRFQPSVGVMLHNDFRQAELERAQVPIHCFNVHSFMRPSIVPALWRLRQHLRRERVELVHSFDTPGNVFSCLGARWAGVPVVLTSQRAHRSLSPQGQLQVLRWTDRWVDGIVVNCAYIRRHLVEDEGVPPERIRLCYNGIDTTAFHPNGSPAQPKPAGRLTVGVICALRPEKDLPTLLTGFAQARSERPELRLLIVGSGTEEAALQAQARTLQLGEDCTFIPAQKDVAQWMRSIDIFVLPSRTEALSNSLMEAMACGCTVMASNVGGNPELVESGKTGLLFETGQPASLAQAIVRLAADSGLRHHLASQSTQLIPDNFSLASSVSQMQRIYEEYLNAVSVEG